MSFAKSPFRIAVMESDAHPSAGFSFPLSRRWTLRVLLVEDCPRSASDLARFLQLHDYDVTIAGDGLTALARAREMLPDVILLDIGLPGMDGWQVVERLRAQAAPKRPLLIAVTGHGKEADRQRSKQAGIDLHLTKPVDVEELSQVLRRFADFLAPE